MTSSQKLDTILATWAKEWKEDNLTPEVIKLISQAETDLWEGPFRDGSYGDPTDDDPEWDSYPGFVKATTAIKAAFRDSRSKSHCPSDLWIDLDAELVSTKEPQPEQCESCEEPDGSWCDACQGHCSVELDGDWYHIEQEDIMAALVGKELVGYL